MGSGKTTVGRLVAERLSWPFVDLDEVVEAEAGRSIREVFATGGESEFRRLERGALLRLLEGDCMVIATGGGTLAQPEFGERVRPRAVTVWLDVPLAVIEGRLGNGERADRPLYGGSTEVSELYESRRKAYQMAQVRVEIGADESADAVAKRVVEKLTDLQCDTS